MELNTLLTHFIYGRIVSGAYLPASERKVFLLGKRVPKKSFAGLESVISQIQPFSWLIFCLSSPFPPLIMVDPGVFYLFQKLGFFELQKQKLQINQLKQQRNLLSHLIRRSERELPPEIVCQHLSDVIPESGVSLPMSSGMQPGIDRSCFTEVRIVPAQH